jgi:NADH dehydrogenase [ubiquinone] 1 alpha subcomplex assembly factor 1
MQGADGPPRAPRTLFSLNTKDDVQQFATGCDADIGGLSTVHFELDESPETNASIGRPGTAKFWGDMRLEVKSGLEGKLRGGYAGFRNKVIFTRPDTCCAARRVLTDYDVHF